MSANVPTRDEVAAVVAEMAASVGDVNVRVSEVMLALDCRFPGMSAEQFAQVRQLAAAAVAPVTQAGIRRIWS